jgi:hypothetical protein
MDSCLCRFLTVWAEIDISDSKRFCRTTADSPGERPRVYAAPHDRASATQRSWINPEKARYYQVFLDQDLSATGP